MKNIKPVWDPVRMAKATADAYSADGFTSWEQCCRLLLQRGYTAVEAEAILRSKWTRWARDGWNGKGTPTSRALSDFLNKYAGTSSYDVAELVAGYDDFKWTYKPDPVTSFKVRVLSEIVETIQIEAASQEEAEELVGQGEYTDANVVDKDYRHTEVLKD